MTSTVPDQHSHSRRSFGARLADAMEDHGPLCVGIDPHPSLLEAWGLADSAAGLRDFALRTVDAVGGRVGAVKPQSAFFERHGSAGIAVLEETLAEASGRGVFVLALTSNPEGAAVQHAVNGERAVAAGVVEGVTASNATASGEGRLGSVGLVVGATVGAAVSRLGSDLLRANGPLLAPGIGAQGAGPAELESVFGSARRHVLASTSRGVLTAGPSIEALLTAALAATHEAAAALR